MVWRLAPTMNIHHVHSVPTGEAAKITRKLSPDLDLKRLVPERDGKGRVQIRICIQEQDMKYHSQKAVASILAMK